MLDAQYIREHSDEVRKATERKLMDAGMVDSWLEIDAEYREKLQAVEALRAERNTLTKDDRERGKALKKELKELEQSLGDLEQQRQAVQMQIPNLVHAETPHGTSEDDNVEHRIVGEKPEFNFVPKDHVELAEMHDLMDFARGAKVAGSKHYYLKNEAALLEVALVQYALQFLMKEGFTPIMTPDMAQSRFYLGTGYLPRGDEAQTYEIKDEDLGLIATAEVTMAGYHADEVLNLDELPKKYVALSHCYRKEAGAYGKFSKGLYRVHQFTKVEMYAFTTPDQSDAMHAHFLDMEEKLWQSLGIPYRVLEMCDADLGGQAVRKYDLEAWMAGKGEQGEWGEITSTSNTTDYQARRLNIKYKDAHGKNQYVHTLNGTALTTSRTPIAIFENYQQADGSILIPKVLQPLMGINKIG